MKLLKLVVLLASLPLLASGGTALYHAAGNRRQTSVTCEQFIRQPPRALWLRVSGCDFDYLGAGYRQSNGRIAELFFPVRPPAQSRTTPAVLVVATRDPQVLAMAEETLGNDRVPDQEAFLVMMLRIVTMLKVSREVEGYARAGTFELPHTRRALAGLDAPLAPQVVVLDLHARPAFLLPGLRTAAGLVLFGVAVALGRHASARRRDRSSIEEAQTLGDPVGIDHTKELGLLPSPAGIHLASPAEHVDSTRGPTPFVPSPARCLPAVMLLNLDASADLAAIEHVPPLGSRSEISNRVTEVLGGCSIDAQGTGALRGIDWRLHLDLGPDDQVWTVVAKAVGEGAIRALETLAHLTGWRMFVPKLGVFVDPAHLRELAAPRFTDSGRS
jgi:hypothetical protein